MQNKWSKAIIIFVVLILQIIGFSFLSSIQTVNDYVINKVTFPISDCVATVTNSIFFPLGEIFYLILFLIGIRLIFLLVRNIIKNKNEVSKSIFQMLVFVNCIYFIYTLFWGVMYKKETLTFDKDIILIEPKVLKEIYCEDLEKAIYARKFISNNDSLTTVKFQSNIEDFNHEFYQLQYKLKDEQWLKNYRFLEHSHYKLSNISIIQNYLGILGYYNPFFAESNLNKLNTDLKKPSTLFHEYAHQMGFASESEANFLAYYIGKHSKNPETNYSIYYKSIFSLLRALYKSDPIFVEMELTNMYPQIMLDRKAEINHYEKFRGRTSDTFSELNNQFLKANNQEGVVSYGKYIEYIYFLYKNEKAKS